MEQQEKNNQDFVEDVLTVIEKYQLKLMPSEVTYDLFSIAINVIYLHAKNIETGDEYITDFIEELKKSYKEKLANGSSTIID